MEPIRAILFDADGVVLRADNIDDFSTISAEEPVVQLVQLLRRQGYLCAIASNQFHDRARYISDELGYARKFDREFYSCDLGVEKPDKVFFETVLSEVALEPSEVLFIDDKQANIEGALNAGLAAQLFTLADQEDTAMAMKELLQKFGVTP